MNQLSKKFRGQLRLFAFYLANGTINPSLIPIGTDYKNVLGEASALEQIFSIWSNVIKLDENGDPLNADYAQERASQWLRSYIDPEYTVDPPFEEWEVELHIF